MKSRVVGLVLLCMLCAARVHEAEARYCIFRIGDETRVGFEDALATTVLRTALRPNQNLMFTMERQIEKSVAAADHAANKQLNMCLEKYKGSNPVVVIAGHSTAFSSGSVGKYLLFPLYQKAVAKGGGYKASTAGTIVAGVEQKAGEPAVCPVRAVLESCFLDRVHNPKYKQDQGAWTERWSALMKGASDEETKSKKDFMKWFEDCVEVPLGQCGDAITVVVADKDHAGLLASRKAGPVATAIGKINAALPDDAKAAEALISEVQKALGESRGWPKKYDTDTADSIKTVADAGGLARIITLSEAYPKALTGATLVTVTKDSIKPCGGVAVKKDVVAECAVPGSSLLQRAERLHISARRRVHRAQQNQQREALQPDM